MGLIRPQFDAGSPLMNRQNVSRYRQRRTFFERREDKLIIFGCTSQFNYLSICRLHNSRNRSHGNSNRIAKLCRERYSQSTDNVQSPRLVFKRNAWWASCSTKRYTCSFFSVNGIVHRRARMQAYTHYEMSSRCYETVYVAVGLDGEVQQCQNCGCDLDLEIRSKFRGHEISIDHI